MSIATVKYGDVCIFLGQPNIMVGAYPLFKPNFNYWASWSDVGFQSCLSERKIIILTFGKEKN